MNIFKKLILIGALALLPTIASAGSFYSFGFSSNGGFFGFSTHVPQHNVYQLEHYRNLRRGVHRRNHRHQRRSYVSPLHDMYTDVRPCHEVYKQVYTTYGHVRTIFGTMCYDHYGHPYIVPGSRHSYN